MAMGEFVWYKYYGHYCTLEMRDANGLVVWDYRQAEVFEWRVFVDSERRLEDREMFFEGEYSDGEGVFVQTTVRDLIRGQLSGNFTLSFDGEPLYISDNDYDNSSSFPNTTDIPYNIDPSTLQQSFRLLPGF